jgi:hypothetical protein
MANCLHFWDGTNWQPVTCGVAGEGGEPVAAVDLKLLLEEVAGLREEVAALREEVAGLSSRLG